MTTTITISAQFTKLGGEPATSLTLADIDITLLRITKSGGAETSIWATQNPTREVTGVGKYQRDYATADLSLYWYFAMATYTGATALDQDDDAGIGRVYGSVGEDIPSNFSDMVISAAGVADGNVVQISADATAADNLELQYDTTGLTGDTFPATQAQLGAIALIGAAINTPAKDAPNGFVIAFGENEVNDEDSTHALDEIYHDIEAQNDTGTERIDVYYEFTIGGDGVPTSIFWEGYLVKGSGASKNITVQAYNWSGAVWDQIGTIVSGTSNSAHDFVFFTTHVGTGANLGLVRVRFVTGSAPFVPTTTLKTDQIFVSYAVVTRSVGYANGAIWIDAGVSNTNTESFVDGTADNPVSTWAAALTLSGNLNINNFHIAGGTTITLTGNSDVYEFFGDAWTLVLAGQSISGAFIHGATVSGIGTGAIPPTIEHCHLNAVTLPGSELRRCGLADTFTCSAVADYFFDSCFSLIAGTATPVIDFGGAVADTNVNFRSYSGGIEVKNLNTLGSDTMSLEGKGQLILNANCAGGTIAIRGHFTVIDNAGGAVTLSDDARYDVDQINAQIDVALDTAIPGGPTANSINERVAAIDDLSQVSGAGDLAAILGDTNELQGDWVDGGRLDLILDSRSDFDEIADPVELLDSGGAAGTSAAELVDDTWDEVLSKAAHNVANSAGRYVRRTGTFFIWEGDAQGPGTGTNQIQLDTGASSVDGAYDPAAVSILDGTGAGQTRLILQYEGSTRIATVDRDWKVNPDATSEFVIFPDSGRGHVNEGLAQGGTASTITLNTLGSPIDNAYIDQRVFISSGTGADQVGRITAYNGTTKVATVAQTWGTIPDTTSGYSMLPDAPALFQGYESAAIWVDTLNGVAGTVAYENGTAENPVNSLADATTLATTLGFSKFMIAPRSSITLAQSYDGFAFGGVGGNGWTLALGGQSISGATIIGATVSGICTGATAPSFLDCSIGTVTIPACRLINCAFTSSVICSAAGTYIFDQCFSGVAGTSTPDIDFGAAVLNTNLNFRHYSGGIEIKNMGTAGVDTMSLEGDGQLIINANCVGGAVAIRGHFTITDNAGGVLTLSDDARFTATELADTVLTRQLTESYATAGVAPTVAQALMLIQQSIGDFGIVGTILTVRNLAGGPVATYVLDDAANPTDRDRSV